MSEYAYSTVILIWAAISCRFSQVSSVHFHRNSMHIFHRSRSSMILVLVYEVSALNINIKNTAIKVVGRICVGHVAGSEKKERER